MTLPSPDHGERRGGVRPDLVVIHYTAMTCCAAARDRVCDPAAVDARARARQAELLDANGGREAVIERGDLGFTPAPGAVISFD